jgi:hypothetical protein
MSDHTRRTTVFLTLRDLQALIELLEEWNAVDYETGAPVDRRLLRVQEKLCKARRRILERGER